MCSTLKISQSQLSVAVVVTVLNEERTIGALLSALESQTRIPDEVIIIDGGSSDTTVSKIHEFASSTALSVHVDTQIGNRSIGRNSGVKRAVSDFIAFTDGGCQPDEKWLEKLIQAHHDSKRPVIAGYYRVVDEPSPFQCASAPFFLVMPDDVNPGTFLPATRSMLIEKSVFFEMGGFDELLSDNEDYAFARKLQRRSVPIAFATDAIVAWESPGTIFQFWSTIFRFARGDVKAGILRPKVGLVFLRYLLGLMIVLLISTFFSIGIGVLIGISMLLFYSIWAWAKLKKYVTHGQLWLPLLQYLADFAVMTGSLAGINQRRLSK